MQAALSGDLAKALQEETSRALAAQESCEVDADEEEFCAEADLPDTAFETTDEFVFDYVSGLLDSGINAASTRSSVEVLPAAATLPPCTHPTPIRQLRPRGQGPPVPAEPFPADCLPSAPALVVAPSPKIDWNFLLAVRPTEDAAMPAAVPEELEAEDSLPSAPALAAAKGDWTDLLTARPAEAVASAQRDATKPAVAPEQKATETPQPQTPSRNRRRIIGGVTRASSAVDLMATSWEVPASPASRRAPKAAAAFRLDAGEAPARESSLARNYDALGTVEFHRLDNEDSGRFPAFASFAPLGKQAPLPSWSSALERPDKVSARGGKVSARGASRQGASAMPSAMAMDLGIEAPKPLASPTRSSSLGSLQVMKSSQGAEGLCPSMMMSKSGALLPALPSKSSSAGSIAWSMRRARSAAKRDVLASVF